MPPVSRSARVNAQYLNDEAGAPADSTCAAIAMTGSSARPAGSYHSILHETVLAREAVAGPKRSRRLIAFVSVIRGTAATTATKPRGRKWPRLC